MGNMRFKVGDRVRIKSLDWYNENKDELGVIHCKEDSFVESMTQYCDNILTIEHKTEDCYLVKENTFNWTDEMIKGLVEEETALNKWTGLKVELELSKSVIDVSNVESLRGERFMSGFVKAIIPPEGYQFVDENGIVIDTHKIVLEKKKKEYPKTYEECCRVLGVSEFEYNHTGTKVWYRHRLMATLDKLMLCRDAYWKLAGEEMGLGKPWEPDWNDDTAKYSIYTIKGVLTKAISCYDGAIFAFPTEEMRDAFKENFDPDIEICKELL